MDGRIYNSRPTEDKEGAAVNERQKPSFWSQTFLLALLYKRLSSKDICIVWHSVIYPPANPYLVRWRSLGNLFLLRTWSQQPPQPSSTGENLVNSRASQPHPFLANETFWLQALQISRKVASQLRRLLLFFDVSRDCRFTVSSHSNVNSRWSTKAVNIADAYICWLLCLSGFPSHANDGSVCIFCSDKTRKDLLWGSMFINAEKINGMTFLLIIKGRDELKKTPTKTWRGRERRRNKELQPALRMQRFVQVFSQFVVCSIVRGVLFEMNSLQTEHLHFCIEHCVSGRDRWRRKEKGENKKKQDNCRRVDEDMNKRWGVRFSVCFAAVLSIWGAINGNHQQDMGCNKMNR